jgi:hypothetical protein
VPTHNQFNTNEKGERSSQALTKIGAFFPIEIHVPPKIAEALTKAGKPVPKCVPGLGLIDTGATLTCISEDVLKGLGLNPFDVVNSGTADGPKKQNVYPARIVFPTKGWTLDLQKAVGVNLKGQVIDKIPPEPVIALLGRNLLQHRIFIYNGVGGIWTVAF